MLFIRIDSKIKRASLAVSTGPRTDGGSSSPVKIYPNCERHDPNAFAIFILYEVWGKKGVASFSNVHVHVSQIKFRWVLYENWIRLKTVILG